MKAKKIAIEIDASADPKEMAEKIADAITQTIQAERYASSSDDLLVLESIICRTALAMAENGEALIKEASNRILMMQKKDIENADDHVSFLRLTEDLKLSEKRLLMQISIDGIAEGDYDKASSVAEAYRNQLVMQDNPSVMN